MSASGSDMSWKGSTQKKKESLFGLMATDDLPEGAFGGLTAQLEVYGRIGLAHAAAVSDMQRNGFLKRPTTKGEIEKSEVRK